MVTTAGMKITKVAWVFPTGVFTAERGEAELTKSIESNMDLFLYNYRGARWGG